MAEKTPPDGEQLLDWMTHDHRPLSLYAEEDGGWIVADNSRDTVVASGATAFEALSRAHLLSQCGVFHQ